MYGNEFQVKTVLITITAYCKLGLLSNFEIFMLVVQLPKICIHKVIILHSHCINNNRVTLLQRKSQFQVSKTSSVALREHILRFVGHIRIVDESGPLLATTVPSTSRSSG